MIELYRLPIKYSIKYKLCVVMHAAVSCQCSGYIREVVTPLLSLTGRIRLKAAAGDLYDVPRTGTVFSERTFSVAGQQQWNALLPDIRNTIDRVAFKRTLNSLFKTCLECNALTVGDLYINLSILFHILCYLSYFMHVRRSWPIGVKKRHINCFFRRNATLCISPYAIVMCVCVCVCVCVCLCRVCGPQENGFR